ncbi:MAG TPA: nucleoside hydrolase, partial [Candidatus Methylomirabilis sp.]|nr:nucleoside hydrolase [Candidatus Methylomirabilis sp.]
LIDTDPGIDDALALLLAFSSPEFLVEAVTTVAGNVSVDLATHNLFRILDVARPAPLPRLARGADAPLRRALVTAGQVHGDDGLGNLDRFVEPDGRPRYPALPHDLEMCDGADLILQMADRFGPELAVVALGPLTNLAIALERDQARLARVGRIVVMGGAVRVPGNVTPAAEFNFYVDPEAAAAVFESGLALELVPLDVTQQVVLRQADLASRLAGCPSRVARFVDDFTLHGFAFGAQGGHGGIALHDPLAVGAALDPSLVGFEALHVQVECEGSITRGMSVADRRPLPSHRKREPNCRVATSVDAARFVRIFLDRLCPASA